MVFTFGDKMGQIGVKAAIAFQRVTAHFRHRPVTGTEVVGQFTYRAARNRIFQQRMIGHDGQAIVALLHAADKARQERLDGVSGSAISRSFSVCRVAIMRSPCMTFFMYGGGMK